MKVSDILEEGGIEVELKSNTKNEVLDELIGLINTSFNFENIDEIRKAIYDREKLSSTGIGNGLAIPHAKVVGVDRIVAGIGLSKKGIDFSSLDKMPAHIFFILISPKEDQGSHVKTLAKIAKIFKNKEWRDKLIECESSKGVIQFIKEKEDIK